VRALYDDDTITVHQAYVSRDGFEWALRHASLSHEPARKDGRPARVQWDPERSLPVERPYALNADVEAAAGSVAHRA
jgi:hypothetical protein